VITGLDRVPRDLWPPVTGVHLSFDLMVGVGFFLLALGVWFAAARWWRRAPNRVFLVLGAIAGPAAVVALECGWTVTEEGRQPWVVQGVMSVHDAVNPAPGLMVGLWLVLVVYAGLTVAVVYVMRRLARQTPVPTAPQERDVESYPVA
jgi:cytochrome d ubiquinol oxidase subunit I